MNKALILILIAVITFSACSKSNTAQPATQAPTYVTINGTNYNIVTIGNQTWTSINYNGDGGENYNNGANDPALGKLYTMAEAQAVTLPSGWRLPSADDYNTLLQGLGGGKTSNGNYGVSNTIALELMSTTGWTTTNGSNQLGFNARPAGFYSGPATQFLYAGTEAFFLINTSATNANIPLSFAVALNQTVVDYFSDGTNNRESVRFVKDN